MPMDLLAQAEVVDSPLAPPGARGMFGQQALAELPLAS